MAGHGRRVELRPHTLGDARAMLAAMSDAERAEVSPEWLARLHSLKEPDPGAVGFAMVLRDGGVVVGTTGYKGQPGADRVVGSPTRWRRSTKGRGTTEAAEALTAFALGSARLRVVPCGRTRGRGRTPRRVCWRSAGFET